MSEHDFKEEEEKLNLSIEDLIPVTSTFGRSLVRFIGNTEILLLAGFYKSWTAIANFILSSIRITFGSVMLAITFVDIKIHVHLLQKKVQEKLDIMDRVRKKREIKAAWKK